MPKDEVDRETIAAIASAPGRGGIGVVRLSGSKVAQIAEAVAGRLPAPRHATLCVFKDRSGRRIDEGIALYFAAPHSYTGEDVLELQGHGGPIVMQMLLAACVEAGARLAEPGEFTRRAFLGGKLDLAQAEAVADLIDAASREAARSALRSLSGEFSAAIHSLVARLTELRALTEAMLDFPEEDVDSLHRDDASSRLAGIRADLDLLFAGSRQGSLLATGIQVVIAGAPNVGKSSLLNRLAGAERAIVTPIPGTTRDAVREPIEIAGVPILLVDTAGLRSSSDEIERIGMDRTRKELQGADVVLAVFEAGGARALHETLPGNATRIDVYNKIDLTPGFRPPAGAHPAVTVSAKTGAGLEALHQAILRAAGWTSTGESLFLARERHLLALERARRHLAAAGSEQERWEFFAEELRLAQTALGEITGAVTANDLLGEIFGRFCIGK
jgi:tRNA modification GTPase